MMRVVALDGLRWIASSHIVIFHRYRDWTGVPRVFAAWGQTWTQFFFIISGFVLGLSEIKKPPGAAEPSLSTYIIRRLRLLYPAYLLSLFFLLALHPHPTHFEWSVLPLHIKLLQSWFPWCVDLAGGNLNIQCSMEYWNRNSWFLSALLFFWIALRPVARALRERSVACNIVIAFCCWSASFVLEWFDHSHRLAAMVGCNEMCMRSCSTILRHSPWGYFHVLVVGIAVARVYFHYRARDDHESAGPSVSVPAAILQAFVRYGCCLGFLAYSMLMVIAPTAIKTHHMFFHNGGLLPVQVIVILGAAFGVDPLAVHVLSSRPMGWLGRLSYIQYLMQGVVWSFLKGAVDNDHVVQIAYFPALVLFSWCCQRLWVESSEPEAAPADGRSCIQKGMRPSVDKHTPSLVTYGAAEGVAADSSMLLERSGAFVRSPA